MSVTAGDRPLVDKPPSTDEWRDIARVPNLYYHILSWPEKEKEGWTQEDFYASGVSDWQDFLDQWRHYDPGVRGGTAVEIGCGAGRLTAAMAADFEKVVALDVSQDMIDHARDASPDNVEFELVDGTEIPRADQSVDAVFSAIVLQHLETFEHVRAYMQDAFRALRPGGTIMLNISLARKPRSKIDRARTEFGIWRSRRGLKSGKVHKLVRWREYAWEDIYLALREIGYEDLELRMFQVRSNGDPIQFWFAQRPRNSE